MHEISVGFTGKIESVSFRTCVKVSVSKYEKRQKEGSIWHLARMTIYIMITNAITHISCWYPEYRAQSFISHIFIYIYIYFEGLTLEPGSGSGGGAETGTHRG